MNGYRSMADSKRSRQQELKINKMQLTHFQ